MSVDQYSRVNEWVYEMKNRNWAQNDPQASIHLATYVGQLKGQMDVMKERIAPYVMENYKTVQAQVPIPQPPIVVTVTTLLRKPGR